MKLLQFYVDEVIKNAIKEDINYIDTSADLVIDENDMTTAYFEAKAEGVLCGLDVALRVFELLDKDFCAKVYIRDGEKVKKGDIIADLTGHTVMLLKGERTALNLLQHMSGIATMTNRAVTLCEGTMLQLRTQERLYRDFVQYRSMR